VATSEHAAVISAKGRNEPLVRNLSEVELGTSLSGTAEINTPLQGDDSPGIPVAEGDQGSLVPVWVNIIWRKRHCPNVPDVN
jgi:hypothetical protein